MSNQIPTIDDITNAAREIANEKSISPIDSSLRERYLVVRHNLRKQGVETEPDMSERLTFGMVVVSAAVMLVFWQSMQRNKELRAEVRAGQANAPIPPLINGFRVVTRGTSPIAGLSRDA